MVLLVAVVAACGGRIADESGGVGGRGDATDTSESRAAPLARLRERCAPGWKPIVVGGSPLPAPALVTGRWLRCPEDLPGLEPPAFVATFDALELTSDHRFFRLSIGSAGFERETTRPGDTGTWRIVDDQLFFTLPPCSEGYVAYGTATSCGGLDAVRPIFEAAPSSRMRFYASGSFYVRDE
jgi:hypothetical protein